MADLDFSGLRPLTADPETSPKAPKSRLRSVFSSDTGSKVTPETAGKAKLTPATASKSAGSVMR